MTTGRTEALVWLTTGAGPDDPPVARGLLVEAEVILLYEVRSTVDLDAEPTVVLLTQDEESVVLVGTAGTVSLQPLRGAVELLPPCGLPPSDAPEIPAGTPDDRAAEIFDAWVSEVRSTAPPPVTQTRPTPPDGLGHPRPWRNPICLRWPQLCHR